MTGKRRRRAIGVAFAGVGAFVTGSRLLDLAQHSRSLIRWLCDRKDNNLADRVRRFRPDGTPHGASIEEGKL